MIQNFAQHYITHAHTYTHTMLATSWKNMDNYIQSKTDTVQSQWLQSWVDFFFCLNVIVILSKYSRNGSSNPASSSFIKFPVTLSTHENVSSYTEIALFLSEVDEVSMIC